MEPFAAGLYVGGRPIDEDADALPEARRHVAQLLGLDHVALLVGSGFSRALTDLAGAEAVSMALIEDFGLEYSEQVTKHAEELAAGRGVAANLEDQLTSAIRLADGLAVQGNDLAQRWRQAIDAALVDLARSVVAAEEQVAAALPVFDGDNPSLQRLMASFVLGFGLRSPTSDRLHVFTTNYDRLIEMACDLAGLRLVDRFVGSVVPRFQPVSQQVDLHYPERGAAMPRPVAGVVHLGKLHGSVDWVQRGLEIVNTRMPIGGPLHAREDGGTVEPLMIYPNSMKDVETAQYPYAPLFRDFSSATARSQSVLFTYGYGFGDSHVNRMISEMLSVPNTHLCCVAYSDSTGRIADFLQRQAVDRWTLLLGPELASLEAFVQLLPQRTPIPPDAESEV